MAHMIEEVVPTIINTLSLDLYASTEEKMSSQVQSLVDRELLDINVFVNKVRPQVEQVLPLHHQPSPYGSQCGNL